MSAGPPSDSSWQIRTTIQIEGGVVVLRVAGRMGSAGEEACRRALADAASKGSDVRLDLAEVDYVSSAGLAVLRDGAAAIHAANGTLTLIRASEPVAAALKLAGEIPFLSALRT